jgi:hypothetical protein
MTTNTDPFDVTKFRFRADNTHNRDMLEYQSEKAHLAGSVDLAAQFAIAAGLYGLLGLLGLLAKETDNVE